MSLKYIVVILVLMLAISLLFAYITCREGLIVELSDNQMMLVGKLDILNSKLDILNKEYAGLTVRYSELYDKRYDINLNDPTYEQVKSILSELKGVKIDGNCVDKVKYVQDYCYNKGIQCYIVVANFKGGIGDFKGGEGHTIVAFNTEKGWIYVEPAGMAETKMVLNQPYFIPGSISEWPVGTTAKDVAEYFTVIQLVRLR